MEHEFRRRALELLINPERKPHDPLLELAEIWRQVKLERELEILKEELEGSWKDPELRAQYELEGLMREPLPDGRCPCRVTGNDIHAFHHGPSGWPQGTRSPDRT